MLITSHGKNLGLFFLTVGFWLLPFWAGRVFIGFTGRTGLSSTAAVLSAASSRTNDQVRYLSGQNYTAATEAVTVYAYPGRTTRYPGIYTMRNQTPGPLRSEVREVRVLAQPDLAITAAVSFTDGASAVTLAAGQTQPLDLTVHAAATFPQPLPVTVTFTVNSF